MADNIEVTPGSGKTIAADDIGGVLYQRIKPAFGADGSATDVSTANPLPVVQTGTPALPSDAATATNQSTEITSLQLLDDTVVADNAAFTDGTTKVNMAGYVYDETPGTALSENDAAAARINANRAQIAAIEDGSTRGRYATVTAANAVKVDNSAVTQPVSAASLPLPSGASTEATLASVKTAVELADDVVKTDDAAFTPATDKVAMVGAEFDDTTPDSVDEGDAGALRMSANRNLYVRIRDNAGNERGLNIDANGELGVSAIRSALPAGNNNIGDVDVASMPNVTLAAGTNTNEVVGDVAQDAAIAGNPLSMGARASTAIPTAMSADGDSVYLWTDRNGAVVVKHRPCATPSQSSVAGSASSTSLLASNTSRIGATIFNDSSAVLYVKLGSTASTSSFTIKLSQDDYYEVPYGYTGAIDGIWASATGNARITELT